MVTPFRRLAAHRHLSPRSEGTGRPWPTRHSLEFDVVVQEGLAVTSGGDQLMPKRGIGGEGRSRRLRDPILAEARDRCDAGRPHLRSGHVPWGLWVSAVVRVANAIVDNALIVGWGGA